jgi:PKD repeat protein
MKRGFYVTITETGKYYGRFPFKAGGIVKISKDKSNGRRKGIRVTLPLLGVIGYLATDENNIVEGTMGANKVYDKIGNYSTSLTVSFSCHTYCIFAYFRDS